MTSPSDTREAILDAAFGLFLEHGFDGTSLARILDAVPYSKGALYHHFATKEALLDAVIERFFTALIEAPQRPRPTTAAALTRRLVDDYVDSLEKIAQHSTPLAYYSFLTAIAPRAAQAIRDAHAAVAAELVAAFALEPSPPRDPETLASDLIAIVEGHGLVAVVQGRMPDRADLYRAAQRVLGTA